METLLSSPNCTDWVEISKMLLGPLPDGFEFVPKHKSNSYPNMIVAPASTSEIKTAVPAVDEALSATIGGEWNGEVE